MLLFEQIRHQHGFLDFQNRIDLKNKQALTCGVVVSRCDDFSILSGRELDFLIITCYLMFVQYV